MSSPKLVVICRSHARATSAADLPLERTTLPLCTYVRTSSKPAASSTLRSSGIAMRLREPMLMPRRSTMWRAMAVFYRPACVSACEQTRAAAALARTRAASRTSRRPCARARGSSCGCFARRGAAARTRPPATGRSARGGRPSPVRSRCATQVPGRVADSPRAAAAPRARVRWARRRRGEACRRRARPSGGRRSRWSCEHLPRLCLILGLHGVQPPRCLPARIEQDRVLRVRAALLDDGVAAARLDHALHLAGDVPFLHDEPRGKAPHRLVGVERDEQAVEARTVDALAHDVELAAARERAELLVQLAEQELRAGVPRRALVRLRRRCHAAPDWAGSCRTTSRSDGSNSTPSRLPAPRSRSSHGSSVTTTTLPPLRWMCAAQAESTATASASR